MSVVKNNYYMAKQNATFRYFGGMADKLEGTVVPVEATSAWESRRVSSATPVKAAAADSVVSGDRCSTVTSSVTSSVPSRRT